MPSYTEQAIGALVTALTAAAGVSTFPAPVRNEALPSELKALSGTVRAWLNVWDGQGGPNEILLGGNSLGNRVFELQWRAEATLVVESTDNAAREASYDAALIAIDNTLRVDRTLGGTVDWVEIERVEASGSGLVTDGMPDVKGCVVTILLSYTSDRPF